MRRIVHITWLFALLSSIASLAHASPPTEDDAAQWAAQGGAADSIPYVIVTTKALRPAFVPLAHRHTRDGLRTEIRTLESIRAGYPAAADDQQRIRLFLQDAQRERGTRWVLLGGDASVIPIRRVTFLMFGPTADRLGTDLYYVFVGGPGPAEGDTVWSAFGQGEALRLGRAPVADAAQARRFVQRTLRALDEAAPGGAQVLLAAGFKVLSDYPADTLDLAPSAEALRPVFEAVPGTHVGRLYGTSSSWPGSSPETRSALIDSLERGYDVAVLLGSGEVGRFAIGSDRRFDPAGEVLTAEDVLALRDSGRPTRYAFLSTFTCAPGPEPTIGSGLMNGPESGAVSVLGSTSLSLIAATTSFLRSFFTELTARSAVSGGEALARVQAASPNSTALGMCLFGDPALPWWPGAPAEPALAGRRDGADRGASAATPRGLALGQPWPNPASAGIQLDLSLAAALAGRRFEAAVFDLSGRRVRRLVRGDANAGTATLRWDLRADDGARVAPGLYFLRVRAGNETQVRRVVVTP